MRIFVSAGAKKLEQSNSGALYEWRFEVSCLSGCLHCGTSD